MGEKPKLFDEVTFSVIRSKSLDDQYALQVCWPAIHHKGVTDRTYS